MANEDIPELDADISEEPASKFDVWRLVVLLRTELLFTKALLRAERAGEEEKAETLRQNIEKTSKQFEAAAGGLLGKQGISHGRR